MGGKWEGMCLDLKGLENRRSVGTDEVFLEYGRVIVRDKHYT